MRRLKYLFESTYVRKHNKNENFIKSIWFITEDEIFESFAELHDGVDVNIEINFYLKGKNFKHELHKDLTIDTPPGRLNLERTEAYAASGLTPCFEVVITKNDSSKEDRRMHAYAIESLHHIEDYSLFDVKRGSGYLKLYLKFDENSLETKALYHKKSARSFNDLLKDFRANRYECNVSRVFINGPKMNLMHTTGSTPIYYMTLEKIYKIELEMIDELSKIKPIFETLLENLFNLPDNYQVENNFDIETVTSNSPTMRGEIRVKFLVKIYEK
jgi:hypothetical protein